MSDKVAESINLILGKTHDVVAVIENTAGQGSNVGNELRQLGHIIDRVDDKSRVGVCLDTCHTYTAGYDIVNEYDKVFEEFDTAVGFGYLRGIHLNDSKKALGSSRPSRQHRQGADRYGFLPALYARCAF